MEEDKGRRSSGGNGNGNGNGAKRQRTDASRRPHSQPDRLLSVSRRSSGESKELAREERNRGSDEGDKGVRVFKRREGRGSSGSGSGGGGGVAALPESEAKKVSPEVKTKVTSNITAGKPNAASEKWVPRIRIKKPEETPVKAELKKRRQRMIVEGSDDDEPEQGLHTKSAESPSPSNARKEAAVPPAVEGVRKSSRVVKRRTFDDEMDFDEPVKAPPRKRKSLEMSEKVTAKQTDVWAEENTESAEEELPRKKQRKASIHEIQKEKVSSKQKVEAVVESPTPKEKALTARQKAMQAKEVSQEHPCTSGREEAPSPDGSVESKERTAPLTARQRSLQACKDGEASQKLIEFPDGLATTDRRRKPKLTEEEKLAKKAEAASKRKQQVEKAAKEMQASAIQKILNQDSRKKKEEKLQKQKQELAEEKKAAEMEVAANAVRWVMGPSGTTVSWPQGTELPSLFSGPISYPPPREKCAACDNTYKYRDSKSKLPLCSLQCYKAIQQQAEAGIVH